MEEEIKVEERSADEAGKHGNDVVVDVDDDPWVKYMEAKLAFRFKHYQPSRPFTICKVPRDIRGVDSAAYDPLVVSIGPYHRGNKSLLDMEQVKWRNLNAFRYRAGKDVFNEYLKAMKEIEPQARACYSGNIDMEADEFIEMMLLDGLFMIMLFSTRGNFSLFLFNKEEPIYAIRGMLRRVCRDMLLLENQLPFFVLERLCTDQCTRVDLWNSARTFTPAYALWELDLLQVIFDEEEGENLLRNEDGVHHLLHLEHLLLKPTSTGSSFEFIEPTEKPPAFIQNMKTLPRSKDKQPPPPPTVIPSAVELHEAGVLFQCVKARRFLDVKFEQGTMKMPRLSVVDSTAKPLLRNFIAYEQCFPSQGNHITSYCWFMDQLVNTPRDVEILKQSKIIENWLGCDEDVALLFNDLCKGTFLSGFDRGYLEKLLEQVTEHTQKTWPKWRAKLMHDYFSNPWAIISLIAAAFVIFFTAVQTYDAVFT